MKTADPDLIDKLNALDEHDRANLLEFLGAVRLSKTRAEDLLESLKASISIRNIGNGKEPG